MKRMLVGSLLFIAYVTAAMIPLEWLWFDPGVPSFSDSVVGTDPETHYSREIKRVTSISYSVTLRDGLTHDVVCEATGGPFDYLPEKSGPLLNRTLSAFAPSDPRCAHLPVGVYFGQAVWTAAYPLRAFLPDFLDRPLGWIVPPKTVTRDIPPFRILPHETKETTLGN